MNEQKYCRECGNELKENAKFCSCCGAPVSYDIPGQSEQQDFDVGQESGNGQIDREISNLVNEKNEKTKKKKRTRRIALIIILAVIVFIFILLICSGVFRSPQGAVKKYYNKYLVSECDPNGLWEKGICNWSKQYGPVDEDDFSDYLTNLVIQDGINFVSYTAKDTNDTGEKMWGNEIYEVTGSLKYRDSGGQLTKEVSSYVCRSGETYKLVLFGVIDKESFGADPEPGEATWDITEIYSCMDGSAIVKAGITNDSSDSISFQASKMEAVLENDENRYSTYSDDVVIKQGESRTFYSAYKNVEENIVKLIIGEAQYYDDSGSYIGHGDYTMTLHRTEEENEDAFAASEAEDSDQEESEDTNEDTDEDTDNPANTSEQSEEDTEAEPTHYKIGETWTVDGQWEFAIDGVSASNYAYGDGQLVKIDYHYKNIGYEKASSDGLYISLTNQKLVDADGIVASEWNMFGDDVIYPEYATVGATWSANCNFLVKSNGNTATLTMTVSDGNGKKQTAIFDLSW